ncbi:MAG TPA: twin-arginine translocase TatA/TatE family subunit [Syntrophobacteria bacterium]|nr:twin-arginine translocase TatA/TatE family subunit [Syntrophobacteria bacterium]
MFGIGLPELIVILAIALIVVGPKKLPELAKALGRGIAEFRRATTDLKESLESNSAISEVKQTITEAKATLADVKLPGDEVEAGRSTAPPAQANPPDQPQPGAAPQKSAAEKPSHGEQ